MVMTVEKSEVNAIPDYSFDIEDAAFLLSALANKQRLAVVHAVKGREIGVNDLANSLGLSQSALSQHLKILRDAKLVQTRRQAQNIYYSSASDAVRRLLDTLEKMFVPHNH
jgi:DNA-binding transcriptional ArsR family regulator